MSLYVKLSTAFPDDPKVIDAGPMAELVYVRAILKCRESLSDGVIHKARVRRWFAGIQAPEKQLRRLVDVKLLETCDEGWRIPMQVWRDWNPTRDEVDEKREAEAERKRAYRQAKKGGPGDVPTGQEGTHGTRDRQPEQQATA